MMLSDHSRILLNCLNLAAIYGYPDRIIRPVQPHFIGNVGFLFCEFSYANVS